MTTAGSKDPAHAPRFRPGDRVHVFGKHPWKGEVGELLSFGPYGPSGLALTGWKIRLHNVGVECYAEEKVLERIR